MHRPATSRRTLAAALASASLLGACTGNTGETSTALSASATESSTPAPTVTPAMAPDAAKASARDAVAAAVAASNDVSAAGPAARAKAFTGPALASANAAAKVLPARTEGEKADAAVSTTGVTVVLAVSRAADAPAQIVAHTTLTKTGAPVLALLTASTASGPYQVAALTPVLAGARIDTFDPTAEGSAAVGDASGLVAAPDEVMASFATTVRFPGPATSKLLTVDPLTQQLRQSARAQSQALGSQGTFAQTFTPQQALGGLRLAGDAGALVFTHLQRRDDVAYRSPQKLTPDKELTLLTGIKQITTEAKLTSNEMVAFVIPTSGQARVVAAADQIVAGSGR